MRVPCRTRTALAAKLNQHKPEPFVEIHPNDATQYGLTHNNLATLSSRWGKMTARVVINAHIPSGSVFVPMHWTAQYAKDGRMGALVNPAVDPISKQPECKHTPVNIKPFSTRWQEAKKSGCALTVSALNTGVHTVRKHQIALQGSLKTQQRQLLKFRWQPILLTLAKYRVFLG